MSNGSPANTCDQNDNNLGNSSAASACPNGTSGPGFACYSLAPWSVSDTLSYGYAAFNSGACGDCYQLEFTGQSNSASGDVGSADVCGKTMIVQVVNIGNIQANQFDIMIPGGGVGQNNACSTQWSGVNLGNGSGGFLSSCESQSTSHATRQTCETNMCNAAFSASGRSDLLAGCLWHVNWLDSADNPNVKYTKVSCPSAITARSGLQ